MCENFVTLTAPSNRPPLGLNKLTPQPNLRHLILWATHVKVCQRVSVCSCGFLSNYTTALTTYRGREDAVCITTALEITYVSDDLITMRSQILKR